MVKKISVPEIFYLIGGIIVLLGILILISENWHNFSYALKVFITFGGGIAFFISAIALIISKVTTAKLGGLSSIFLVMSGILTSFGYSVMFGPYITSSNHDTYNIIVPFLLLIQFGITQLLTKKEILTIFNTIFGTWLLYAITNVISNDGYMLNNFDLYRGMLVGISYLFIGHYIDLRKKIFSSFFNSLGLIGLLSTSFILNINASNVARSIFYGSTDTTPSIWLALFPIILLATLIGSVWLKKSQWLFWGVIFLIAYIIRITAQYFSNVMGWPIALIFMGLVVIILGYFAFQINKKYIKI